MPQYTTQRELFVDETDEANEASADGGNRRGACHRWSKAVEIVQEQRKRRRAREEVISCCRAVAVGPRIEANGVTE